MSLLVCHTDAKRAFAYTAHTDEVMPPTKQAGWVRIDRKWDWKNGFPKR